MKIIKFCLLFCLIYLVSCGRVNATNSLIGDRQSATLNVTNSKLAETTTPKIIKELNRQLEQYTPQVKIISPKKQKVFNQTKVSIQLEVKDLPIFKDDKLKLGNHLDLILDNEPARQIYDLTEPIVLEDLTPGTHTIRVFASRPWGESYKNEGAYAQTTFSVLTETNDNRPDENIPLLTYSNPTGTYSAEPFLLDFYLTNAPSHDVAQKNPNIKDWRIKATVNGDSFFIENWQPIYLKGLNKGENWIQLELIDEAGNDIENVFNNTARVISYDPQQSDILGQLVTDKLSLAEARPIVEQKYYIQPIGTPERIESITEPENELEPTVTEEKTSDTIESIEEPTVEDKTESATELNNIIYTEDNNKDFDKPTIIYQEETNSSNSVNETEITEDNI